MYFQIRCNEDGVCITKLHDISAYLKECVEEGTVFAEDFPEDNWNKKREEIHNESFLEETEVLLIKGEIITPKVRKFVQEYEIED